MKKILIMTLVIGLSSACSSVRETAGKNTATGAAIGAVVGAAAGVLTNKSNKGKGAAVGGAVGATLGATIGYHLDKQAKELEQVAETKRTEDGIVTKLKGDITFETNRYDLTAAATQKIGEIAEIIKKYPEDILKIKGHTDSTGSHSYNQDLSVKRAQAVSNLLVARGVPASTVTSLGLGPDAPVADNSTTTGRAANRRVEIEIAVDETKIKQ